MPPFLSGQRITGYPSPLPRDIGDHRPWSYNGRKNSDYWGIWIWIQTWRRQKPPSREGDLLLKGCDPSKFGEERNNFLKILSCPCSLRAADWRPLLSSPTPPPHPPFVEWRICPKLVRPWPLGARENTIAATKITSRKELLLNSAYFNALIFFPL